jgi:prepilin-type N-terminal cleavage/methylation domain-containing protein
MKKNAFTLIELLVVIAIVGILATIVGANLNNARTKAKDASIKASLNSLRSGGENFANANNGNYINYCVDNNCASGSIDWQIVCSSVKRQNNNQTTTCTYNGLNTTWCASSPLNLGQNYCVDNSGHGSIGGACVNGVCP